MTVDNNNAPLSQPLYGATMGQAVKRFFKKYARFSGYASRSEYWWVTLFMFLITVIPSVLTQVGLSLAFPVKEIADGIYQTDYSGPVESTTGLTLFIVFGLIQLIIFLITIVPSLAVTWRRLHDAGFSGLFYFLSFIPFAGIVIIILTILPENPSKRNAKWNDNSND